MKKKTVHISFRITEEESIKLDTLMHLSGFRNRSLFIRNQLLGGRVQRRNLRRTEANLSRQMEQLHADISRIGNNYNQAVHALNIMAHLQEQKGSTVVTKEMVDGKLTDMKLLMESLLTATMRLQCEIEEWQEV